MAQSLTWCNQYGVLIDYSTDKEGFIRQASEEMLAAFKMFDSVWNSCPWISDWSTVDIYITDENGEIRISGITGTVVVKDGNGNVVGRYAA